MPDRTPEHNEHPPQWPPLPLQDESTSRPQPTSGFNASVPETSPPEWPMPSRPDGDVPRAPSTPPHGFGAPAEYGTSSIPSSPTTFAAEPIVPSQPGPPNIGSTTAPPPPEPEPEPEPEPAPKKVLAQPPPTHGRGVRMTIYGIGGAIAIGLIVVIVVMAGGTILPPGLSSDDEEAPNQGLELVTEDGSIDPAVYSQLASAVGTEEWIDWRFGEPADEGPGGDTVAQPEATPIDLGDKIDHVAQYGDASAVTTAKNVQGQFATVTDSGHGVGHMTTVEVTDSSIGFQPRPGGRFSDDVGEPELTETSTAKCLAGADLGRVVAIDRASDTSRAAHAVVAFSTGAIATTGISGAQGGTCVQLPAGNVPTAVAVTPANEFALVTVWDTEQTRGRLAVIALGDKAGTYASSWPTSHPGLPNPGHFAFAKLLGFVDLPDVAAPTAIAVGTDYANDFVDRRTADMSTTTGRAVFADDVATNGFVAIASMAERKVQWVDLKPLLSGVSETYFTGDPSGYASPGLKPEAWPPSFETTPDYAPSVAGMAELEHAPLSMAAIGTVTNIALADGTVTRFDVSDAASASMIGSIVVPGPATCLVTSTDQKSVIATSRQDRSVTWIDSEGAVQHTLRDANLVDPLCAQDSPDTVSSNGTGTSVRTITIADFAAGALHTYRFGPASLTDGTTFELKAGEFEYGGSFTTDGKPFAISTALDQS